MAREYKGTVVRVALGKITSQEDVDLLGSLLGKASGVDSYKLDLEEGVLIAFLDDTQGESEEALVRALVASGVYPRGISEVGSASEDGKHVC